MKKDIDNSVIAEIVVEKVGTFRKFPLENDIVAIIYIVFQW